jgi:ATP-binding cassette subfamily B protein
MIRGTPVLLDEPTTGLDADAARRILTPVRRLMAGRTTVIISHNLLTVTDADQIFYLVGGRIVASGTHAELLVTSPGNTHLYRLHQQPRPGRRHGRVDRTDRATGAYRRVTRSHRAIG